SIDKTRQRTCVALVEHAVLREQAAADLEHGAAPCRLRLLRKPGDGGCHAARTCQRARNASRRRSAAPPAEVRAARLASGVRPCPALCIASAAARYASRNGTPAAACSTATSVAYIDGSIAARISAAFHVIPRSKSGSSASADMPR